MLGRKLLIGLLVFFNLFLFFRLIWSGQGIFAYFDLKGRHELLREQLKATDRKSLELSREIRRLKNNRSYQEKVIRDRMNFIKENEILYVFPESSGQSGGVGEDEEN